MNTDIAGVKSQCKRQSIENGQMVAAQAGLIKVFFKMFLRTEPFRRRSFSSNLKPNVCFDVFSDLHDIKSWFIQVKNMKMNIEKNANLQKATGEQNDIRVQNHACPRTN